MNYVNTQLVIESDKAPSGELKWRSPSNIALVKYWGKHGIQLPNNASISFTLENAYTDTKLAYSPKENIEEKIDLDFYFEGQKNEAFAKKVNKFFESLIPIFPFIEQFKFTIHSSNSFPHSAGIASSASAMSALALCLCSLEHKLFGTLKDDSSFEQKASYIARLGSGSACRSIYGGLVTWGETTYVPSSSNLYAIKNQDIHPVFTTYRDDILIVDKGEKSVSSRAGHGLMENNIFAPTRYDQAKRNMHEITTALKVGDIERVGEVIESEALTLHALMMTSYPSYILLKPNTLTILDKVKTFRKETKLPLYFSLDAGPNPHLLYPDNIQAEVQAFIQAELISHCHNGQWIQDKVGNGPIQMS